MTALKELCVDRKGTETLTVLSEISQMEPMVGDALKLVMREIGLTKAPPTIIRVSSSCVHLCWKLLQYYTFCCGTDAISWYHIHDVSR